MRAWLEIKRNLGLSTSKVSMIRVVRILGSATLLLVVAKLFLVDLAALETIWRVLLFMGFGALFLLLSYLLKNLLPDPEKED